MGKHSHEEQVGLHYDTAVRAGGTDTAFFELANAALVRFTVTENRAVDGGAGGSSGGGRGGGGSVRHGEEAAGGGGGSGSGSGVDLVVEQDQSLHDSCGGIVWESSFCLAEYLRRCVKRRCKVGRGCGASSTYLSVRGFNLSATMFR